MTPVLSIIVPVYYNGDTLRPLYSAIRQACEGALEAEDLEVVFVDDGSGDDSFQVLEDLARDNREQVRVLKLSRNFGSHAAILAGLGHCRGRYAALIGADLQEEPRIVLEMLEEARRTPAEVVLGCREEREEGMAKVAFATLYYWLMRTFSQARFPPGGFDSFLIGRKVIQALVAMHETNTSITAQILWCGFRQSSIRYVKRERPSGRSRWTLRKKTRLLLDSLISFSHTPVRLIELFGFGAACLGFTYAALILARYFLGVRDIAGWASLMVVTLTLSGLMLLALGIIGEYLWRILDAARRRPGYLVSEWRNFDDETDQAFRVMPRRESPSGTTRS